MLDLILALALLAGPAACAALGIRDALTGAVMTASLLTWPGYVLGAWLWPRRAALGLGQRLALAPALSLLVSGAATTACWFALPGVALETVYWVLVAVTAVLGVGAAAARRRVGEEAGPPAPAVAGAAALFACTGAVLAVAALGPGATAAPLATALYLDPAAQVQYDPASDSLLVPVVVSAAEAGALELRAERFAQPVAVQQVWLAPGARELRVAVPVPLSSLPADREGAVTISLHAPEGGAPLRQLRVLLGRG